MILRAKVKVARTFNTKKLDNLAMLGAKTLKQKGCWSSLVDDTEGKGHGQVTMILNTKKLIIWQCFRLEPLNLDGMLVLTSR